MRSKLVASIPTVLIALSQAPAPASLAAQDASPRHTILVDDDWRFHRGGAQRAEQPEFDDAAWRKLDLPHDWSIEDIPGTASPFDRNAVGQVSTGFTVGGTGWYRKRFVLPDALKSKRVIVQFDGVYMNAEVWVNGQALGSHPYGYTSFWYDITDKVKFGAENLLAVKVRNEGENSRWYTGSGIYRHVWLKLFEPVHVAQWGTSVITADVTAASATVRIRTRLENQAGNAANVTVTTRIYRDDAEAGRTSSSQLIAANGSADVAQEIAVAKPALWSPESPALYTAVSEVRSAERLLDRVETRFGIRSIRFGAVNGFQLNGKAMKLKGGNVHHDNGPLGSRAYDRAEERRIELLKASGYNTVRCAHNPPSPAFLDAADRLGMLVIDETFDMWQDPKNPHDYSLFFEESWRKDVESMIARDRNHPSIVSWSIGNEIPGMDSPRVVDTAKVLAAFVRELDPTRPVLAAVNNLNPKKDPFMSALDIAGYNYGSGGDHMKPSLFKTDHERVPGRMMIQTESYPLEAFQSWMDVLDHPWVLGDFVWTALDYIGEASIGWRGYWQENSFFPWNLAFCGDIDICGWKRPQSYYRDALWQQDRLSLFVTPPSPSFPENPDRQVWSKWHWVDVVADWNWAGHENKPLKVSAYSSYEEAELFLNAKSLGRKKTDRSSRFTATWDVPYQPGELKVVGYRGGTAGGSSVLKTAGDASSIVLTADRDRIEPNGQDLSYVTIELRDANGTRNPKAENPLTFAIEGPGAIAAVANANPVSLESYQRPARKAWQGRALVIVRSTKDAGDIRLRVSSAGLPSSEIVIRSTGGNASSSSSAAIELWRQNKVAFGVFVPREEPARSAAYANPLYDFLFLNQEQRYDAPAVQAVIEGARAAKTPARKTVIVRIPPVERDGFDAAKTRIAEVFALGGDGVAVPHIRGVEEARQVLAAFRATRANIWSSSNARGDKLAMLMLEDPGAVAQANDVAGLAGYSVIACGIGSLTQALGGDRVAAEQGNQKVLAESRRAKLVNMLTATTADVEKRVQQGYLGLVAMGPDVDAVIRSGRAAAGRD